MPLFFIYKYLFLDFLDNLYSTYAWGMRSEFAKIVCCWSRILFLSSVDGEFENNMFADSQHIRRKRNYSKLNPFLFLLIKTKLLQWYQLTILFFCYQIEESDWLFCCYTTTTTMTVCHYFIQISVYQIFCNTHLQIYLLYSSDGRNNA